MLANSIKSLHAIKQIKLKVWRARAKEWEEHRDSPDLQTAELQCHPITDFTGLILHVITTHLSRKETEKSDKPIYTTVILDYLTTVEIIWIWWQNWNSHRFILISHMPPWTIFEIIILANGTDFMHNRIKWFLSSSESKEKHRISQYWTHWQLLSYANENNTSYCPIFIEKKNKTILYQPKS